MGPNGFYNLGCKLRWDVIWYPQSQWWWWLQPHPEGFGRLGCGSGLRGWGPWIALTFFIFWMGCRKRGFKPREWSMRSSVLEEPQDVNMSFWKLLFKVLAFSKPECDVNSFVAWRLKVLMQDPGTSRRDLSSRRTWWLERISVDSCVFIGVGASKSKIYSFVFRCSASECLSDRFRKLSMKSRYLEGPQHLRRSVFPTFEIRNLIISRSLTNERLKVMMLDPEDLWWDLAF